MKKIIGWILFLPMAIMITGIVLFMAYQVIFIAPLAVKIFFGILVVGVLGEYLAFKS